MPALVLLALLAMDSPLPDDAVFNEGLRLLEDFEYEKAIFRFREAVRDETKSPKQKAICHVYIGSTLAELREDAAASAAFEDAVRADPLATLPADASPKVKALLEQARRSVAEQAAATPEPEPEPVAAPDPVAMDPGAPHGDDGGGGGVFLISGGVLAGLGGLTIAGAAVPLVIAIDLNQQAVAAPFGDETARLNGESLNMQIVAGAVAAGGVLLLAGGGALIALGLLE